MFASPIRRGDNLIGLGRFNDRFDPYELCYLWKVSDEEVISGGACSDSRSGGIVIGF